MTVRTTPAVTLAYSKAAARRIIKSERTMIQFCQLCGSMPCRCGTSAPLVDWSKANPPSQWVPYVHTPSQRERIATAAMQAIATSTTNGWCTATDAPEIARRAVALTDALIAALRGARP